MDQKPNFSDLTFTSLSQLVMGLTVLVVFSVMLWYDKADLQALLGAVVGFYFGNGVATGTIQATVRATYTAMAGTMGTREP